MPVVLAVVAALGGLVFWRRKQFGQEAQKFGSAARQTVHELRSGRKDLLLELGERVYAKSTGDEDPAAEAEISRLIGELVQIDAATKSEEEPAVETDTAV